MRYFVRLLKRVFGVQKGASISKTASADKIEALEHQVMKDLLENHGIRPFYVPDIADEADLKSKVRHLPLFYVWGQTHTSKGLSFTFGLNGLVVSSILIKYQPPGHPKFKLLKARIERKLHKVAYDALMEECQHLNLSPQDILEIWMIDKTSSPQ